MFTDTLVDVAAGLHQSLDVAGSTAGTQDVETQPSTGV